jgi:hypothetical protein
MTMFKASLMLASLGCALAITSVQAQTTAPVKMMGCTQAELTTLDADAAKMTDATKKAAAMKEVTMAKDMMAKKDVKGCATHMDNAMKMMPKS